MARSSLNTATGWSRDGQRPSPSSGDTTVFPSQAAARHPFSAPARVGGNRVSTSGCSSRTAGDPGMDQVYMSVTLSLPVSPSVAFTPAVSLCSARLVGCGRQDGGVLLALEVLVREQRKGRTRVRRYEKMVGTAHEIPAGESPGDWLVSVLRTSVQLGDKRMVLYDCGLILRRRWKSGLKAKAHVPYVPEHASRWVAFSRARGSISTGSPC